MDVIREALVAFLASVGLTALVWLSLEWLLRRREYFPRATLLLPLTGAADEAEESLYILALLRLPRQIVLVDCGLNEEGRHRVQLLVHGREDRTLLVPADLPEYIKKR